MASEQTISMNVGMLADVFGRELSQLGIAAYVVALADLPDDAVNAAAQALLKSSTQKFMPTPGELRALAVTGGRGIEPLAAAAWDSLCRAIRVLGAARSVNFRDAVINAVVRHLGGWERACTLSADEFEKWYKRDFLATYASLALAQTGPPAEATGYLVGQLEKANAHWVGKQYGRGGKVYQLPAPVDVGAKYRPLLVSPPAAKQITTRAATAPRIEFRKP